MSDYKVFTCEFDRHVVARDFLSLVSETRVEQTLKLAGAQEPRLLGRDELKSCKEKAASTPLEIGRAVILVDQSGGLRGKYEARVVKAVDALASILEAKGIPFAVVAFTTLEWKGGPAFLKWKAIPQPRPEDPGRLCDRLHILYKGFDERWGARKKSPRHLLDLIYRDPNMRENIDGEAIEFASEMLEGADAPALILVGDGSPVDDATLSYNPPRVLTDHAAKALDEARVAGIATALLRPDDMGTTFQNIPYATRFDIDMALGPKLFGTWEGNPFTHITEQKIVENCADFLRRLSNARHDKRVAISYLNDETRSQDVVLLPLSEVEAAGPEAVFKGRTGIAARKIIHVALDSPLDFRDVAVEKEDEAAVPNP